MGAALQVVGGRALNPGATFTALTLNTGDSLVVRNFPFESKAVLSNCWAQGATAGSIRIRSPRLHDNVQGIRLRYLASDPKPLLPYELDQQLYAQDQLTVEITGGGAETDAAFLMLYYPDLPGIDARLRRWEEVSARIVNVLTIEQAVTTGGTASDWGGGQAINADFDLLKANTDYALLGYVTDVTVGAIGVTGPDTGNLRVGGPGTNDRIDTRDWFVEYSRQTGLPCIPVINSANRGATTFDLSHTATAAAVNVDLIVAELSQG